jgi:hypothetical protein
MQRTNNPLIINTEHEQEGVHCYYCGSQMEKEGEVIHHGKDKYYHRKCLNTLFTLTSRSLTESQKQKTWKSKTPWYFIHT